MIALAATFNPRGETGRLERLYPQMQAVYQGIVISMPPGAPPEDVARVEALPGVTAFVNPQWAAGRYTALEQAVNTGTPCIQYADLDRLIRWVETRPDEWRRTLALIERTDCLVIGRTAAAWNTHPRVMIEVERIINAVFSFHLGQELDFGAGSKGFSREAAAFILANSRPAGAIGSDSEWPILCHRAGFQVRGVLVDGLDWEIPDQYQEQAADLERQLRLAADYDADPRHWAHRVATTVEVIECGLSALRRDLVGVK